jgi:hypothetical protein
MASAEQLIVKELNKQERLLWSGRPRQGLRLRPDDIYMIPFSLMWGGFAFFWEFGVTTKKAPIFFELWGIPFVLVGIYMIIGRFFWDSYKRKSTYYGLTNQRAIIIQGGSSGNNVKAVSLKNIDEISLQERSDGSGNIVFGPVIPRYARRSYGQTLSPTFDLIDDVRKVYDQVKHVQSEASLT